MTIRFKSGEFYRLELRNKMVDGFLNQFTVEYLNGV